MGECLKTIDEYYSNLVYGDTECWNDKEEALKNLSDLTKEMNFADVNNFSERFLKTALLIEKHYPLFKTGCNSTDTITTIIQYLKYFGTKFMLVNKYDEEYEKDELVLLIVFTILAIYNEDNVSNTGVPFFTSFLEHAIIKNSSLGKLVQYQCLIHLICDKREIAEINRTNNEIILLDDSDLYAVIRYLKNKKFLPINKVWVQEPIKEKFSWLMKEYLESIDLPIYTFRTKKELLTDSTPNKINIVSIWTEDVVFAKNLAMSLNRDVLFINSYMDFYGGIVVLPYTKVFEDVYKYSFISFDDLVKKLNVVQKSLVHDLFYDGIWQQPIKCLTSDDINKCINSAKKGFKIWSNKSLTYRIQVLSKFASTLVYNGKSVLADIISKWIKFSCIYENFLLSYSQNKGLEVTKIRNPRGVIILKEEDDETALFHRLMPILIVGNSVIIICNRNSSHLLSYYNMFSVSQIPAGVINLLSSEYIKELELSLCGMDYADYAKLFFSEDNFEETYMKLTKPKQIIMPLINNVDM